MSNGLKLKYFVLKPGGGSLYSKASRKAVMTYAVTIESENRALANDLKRWIHQYNCPHCDSDTGLKLTRDGDLYCEDCEWPDTEEN